jgi:hypothetical protein
MFSLHSCRFNVSCLLQTLYTNNAQGDRKESHAKIEEDLEDVRSGVEVWRNSASRF